VDVLWRSIVAVGLAVSLVAVLWLAVRGGPSSTPSCHEFRFDKEAWNTEPGPRRQRQARALVKCGTLEGLRPREIVAKLGRPGRVYPDEWWWTIGADNLSVDQEVLSVTFKRGRVSRAEIAQT
jgi:hypothetical protein